MDLRRKNLRRYDRDNFSNWDGQEAGRDSQKKQKAVEQKIAKLDEEKRASGEKLLIVTDAKEAQRLHAEPAKLTDELTKLEEEWLELSAD